MVLPLIQLNQKGKACVCNVQCEEIFSVSRTQEEIDVGASVDFSESK